MNDVASYLTRHQFKNLFIEVLGWDCASGTVELTVDDRGYSLSTIAQKRGLLVLQCQADHATLYNRSRLRHLQRKLAVRVHEHLVIYSCDIPRKQVWQWAVRLEDGRRLRHREHPFFSESPPPRLLSRLDSLRFSLDEEEEVTLMDALGRLRSVLDTAADLNLFVNKPWYAQRSDELAEAVEKGGEAELHEFLEFHFPLVRWAVRPYVSLFHGELEDAEQTGMMGLIYAARHYERSRGFQFSTYATRCIQGFCKRDVPLWYLPVRLPEYVIWPCLTLQKTLDMVAAKGGRGAVREYLADLAVSDPGLYDAWSRYDRLVNMRSLSDTHEPEYREARNLTDHDLVASEATSNGERDALVRQVVERLKPRDVAFVRLKYGFEGGEQTLEEIGQAYGLTRERVRQRLAKAFEWLKFRLAPLVEQSANGNENGEAP